MTIDNASSFELHKWYVGRGSDPVFRVAWENGESIEDSEGNFDDGEQSREFTTLDEALEFGRALLLAVVL
jgi:hypothetical protein